MKKRLIFILLLATLSIGSCIKDKSNFNYDPINEITITDTVHSKRIYIAQNDTLVLNPDIELNGNNEHLSYEWFVYNNSPQSQYTTPRTTIANSRELNYIVDPALFTLGEDYRLTYRVTNNDTGISYFHLYDLSISNVFTKGWLFLEEVGGAGDLSMVLDDGTIFHHIYTERNPDAPISSPISISSSAFQVTDDMSDPGTRIYLLSENNGEEFDGLTMTKKFDYNYLFFAPPSPTKPSLLTWRGYRSGSRISGDLGLAINDGKLHTNLVGGFPGTKKWGEALASPAHGYDYQLFPAYAGASVYGATYPVIMFDQQYQSFYNVSYNGMQVFPENASDPTIFDMNQTGLTMLSLDSSNVAGTYNAIMKDDANNAWLLQFKTIATADNPAITLKKQSMNAAEIVGATDFCGATLSPHLFYAKDNKLYRYETTSNNYQVAHNFITNERINKLEYQINGYGINKPRLVVATWNGTEGKVYYFEVSNAGNIGEASDVFSGFGKIIDMAYKF